jgi:hypothetical protein
MNAVKRICAMIMTAIALVVAGGGQSARAMRGAHPSATAAAPVASAIPSGCWGCAEDPSGLMCGGGSETGYEVCGYSGAACDPAHAACATCEDCQEYEGWGWYNYGCGQGCPVEGIQNDLAAAVKGRDVSAIVRLIADSAAPVVFDLSASTVTAFDCAGRPAAPLVLDPRLRRQVRSALVAGQAYRGD